MKKLILLFTLSAASAFGQVSISGATLNGVTVSNASNTAYDNISPSSVTFGSHQVGLSDYAYQTVTITNTGGGTNTFTSTAASGDFAVDASSTCSGTLAAGANCVININFVATTTGARSGTLTITDSSTGSPHTVSLSGTGATSTVLFTGTQANITTPGNWDHLNGSGCTVNSSAPLFQNDTNNIKCHFAGSGAVDDNEWFSKIYNSTTGCTSCAFRGNLYFKTPVSSPTAPNIQRKIMEWSDSTDASTFGTNNYTPTLTSVATSDGHPALSMFLGGSAACAPTATQAYNLYTFAWDTWYAVEADFTLNTPGASDGTLTIYINGTSVYNNTSANIRGTCATPLAMWAVGRQTDNTALHETINEDRFWSRMTAATSYIGP